MNETHVVAAQPYTDWRAGPLRTSLVAGAWLGAAGLGRQGRRHMGQVIELPRPWLSGVYPATWQVKSITSTSAWVEGMRCRCYSNDIVTA